MTPAQPQPGASIDVLAVAKLYDDSPALTDVDLTIRPGEFITLLGASGSGKTTLLNIIAGFLAPTSGSIRIDGRDVTRIPPHKRNLGMVFQNYALFPHMSVFDNVAFSLRRRRYSREAIRRAVDDALDMVELRHLAERRPAQLSGGQQQRIALARAIVFRPSVLLLDEPLGALDKRLRDQLQGELKRLHRDLGITFVLVTHDQEEALGMSDRIAMMRDGRIAQVGTPRELYDLPSERYIGEFLGESNILTGALGEGRFRTEDASFTAPPSCADRVASSASLLIRPERVRILPPTAPPSAQDSNRLAARVSDVTYLGSTCRVELDVPGQRRFVARLGADALASRPVAAGDEVLCEWSAAQAVAFDDDRRIA